MKIQGNCRINKNLKGKASRGTLVHFLENAFKGFATMDEN
jgi:hypothetical protein